MSITFLFLSCQLLKRPVQALLLLHDVEERWQHHHLKLLDPQLLLLDLGDVVQQDVHDIRSSQYHSDLAAESVWVNSVIKLLRRSRYIWLFRNSTVLILYCTSTLPLQLCVFGGYPGPLTYTVFRFPVDKSIWMGFSKVVLTGIAYPCLILGGVKPHIWLIDYFWIHFWIGKGSFQKLSAKKYINTPVTHYQGLETD